MVRFIHTSDLHLGKRFGQFPEELRGRLTEARHQCIGKLNELAHSQNAGFVLVAGDVFDTGTPSPAIIRQSLRAMGANSGVKWVLLPGNHDPLAADQLWQQVANDCPDNIILAVKNEALEVAPATFVIPAPCFNRRSVQDLTRWMQDGSLPSHGLRLGLAHGDIKSFGTEKSDGVIEPDRARRAGLDYLALGNWHAPVKINERTWYSGTPEPDSFKHDPPAKALVVSIDGGGAVPQVIPIETGSFDWQHSDFPLLPGEDAEIQLSQILPEIDDRRETLLDVTLEGRIRLPQRLVLEKAIEKLAPDFAWMQVHWQNLAYEYEIDDLDRIDQAGALRQAAEVLARQARLDDDPHGVSASALSLLYSLAVNQT